MSFGFHLVDKDKEDGTGSTLWKGISYLRVYTEEGSDIVLTITEIYKPEVHDSLIKEDGYVTASTRLSEEELIRVILDIIPFWKIADYHLNCAKQMIIGQIRQLEKLGVSREQIQSAEEAIAFLGTS